MQLIITHFAHDGRLEDSHLDTWALGTHTPSHSHNGCTRRTPHCEAATTALGTTQSSAIEDRRMQAAGGMGAAQVACWVFCKSCCLLAFMLHFQMLVGRWRCCTLTQAQMARAKWELAKLVSLYAGPLEPRFGPRCYEKKKSARSRLIAARTAPGAQKWLSRKRGRNPGKSGLPQESVSLRVLIEAPAERHWGRGMGMILKIYKSCGQLLKCTA